MYNAVHSTRSYIYVIYLIYTRISRTTTTFISNNG